MWCEGYFLCSTSCWFLILFRLLWSLCYFLLFVLLLLLLFTILLHVMLFLAAGALLFLVLLTVISCSPYCYFLVSLFSHFLFPVLCSLYDVPGIIWCICTQYAHQFSCFLHLFCVLYSVTMATLPLPQSTSISRSNSVSLFSFVIPFFLYMIPGSKIHISLLFSRFLSLLLFRFQFTSVVTIFRLVTSHFLLTSFISTRIFYLCDELLHVYSISVRYLSVSLLRCWSSCYSQICRCRV